MVGFLVVYTDEIFLLELFEVALASLEGFRKLYTKMVWIEEKWFVAWKAWNEDSLFKSVDREKKFPLNPWMVKPTLSDYCLSLQNLSR